MAKSKKKETLTPEEVDVLKDADAGAAYDSIDVSNVESKINISSQNKDTGLPSYNPGDTRPYERKNTPPGFHRSGTGDGKGK